MNRENTDIPTSSLYVGNLHHSVTEAVLFEKFSVVGPIHFLHVCRHRETQLSLGFGFVTFASTEHAKTAMDIMNFDMMKGEIIRLLWTKSVPSLPKTSVEDTVKTLKKHAEKRDIFELFILFKNILRSSSAENEDERANKLIVPKAPLNNDSKTNLSDVKRNEVRELNNIGLSSSFKSETSCVSKKEENLTQLDEEISNIGQFRDITLPDVKSIEPDLQTKDFTHDISNVTPNLVYKENDEYLEDEGYQTIDENYLSYDSNEIKKPSSVKHVPSHIVNSNSSPAKLAISRWESTGTSKVKSLIDEVQNEKPKNIRFIPQKLREINSDSERVFRNVYVKNFGLEMKDEDLFELFHEFGPILSCEVMRDDDDISRGFGFVFFESPKSARQAVDALNGKMLRNGKQIYVSRAQKKAERCVQLKQSFENKTPVRQYQGTNLYVKNLDDSVDDFELHETFSRFGTITSAKVMKEQHHSRGFGFVCFSTPTEATKAVTEMNGTIVGSKPLYVALAQRKEDRQAHLASQCVQLVANSPKLRSEQKDPDSDLKPVTFEDIILSESPQVIPDLDDLLPVTPASVVSNITDSLSSGEIGVKIPYQLEHLPNPVQFPLAGLPKRKVGHYKIGHPKGALRQSVNATCPDASDSPQRSTHTVMNFPTMRKLNGEVVYEGYEPIMDYSQMYIYHQNDPSFIKSHNGIHQGMISH